MSEVVEPRYDLDLNAPLPEKVEPDPIGLGSEMYAEPQPANDEANATVAMDEPELTTETTVADSPTVVQQTYNSPTPATRRGTRPRSSVNKATRRRHQIQFERDRRQAARQEAAGVDPEMLQATYRDFLDQHGRAPEEGEVLAGFRTALAGRKAQRLIEVSDFARQAEEDKAWEEHEAEDRQNGLTVGPEVFPPIDDKSTTLYDKPPVNWTRGDIIAIYGSLSKEAGRWLSGSELQELCKTGFMPAQYRTIIAPFGGIANLMTEAKQEAVWYQAKNERERDASGEQLAQENIRADQDTIDLEPDTVVVLSPAPEIESDEDKGEMYQSILDVRRFAKSRPQSGPTLRVTILDDHTIQIGHHTMSVDGHRLYALNALLLSREALTAQELSSFGFDPKAKISQLTAAIKGLDAAITRATGWGVIGKWGNGKKALYEISPQLMVADARRVRNVISEAADASVNQRTASAAPEVADFESNSERDLAIIKIVNKYRTDPRVETKLASLKTSNLSLRLGENELGQYFHNVSQFALLNEVEETELFSYIERGLSIYQSIQGAESIAPQDEEALINLAVARQLLFLSNLRLVASVAKKHNRLLLLPDAIHEGNIGLSKAISLFDYTQGYKFSTYATWWIRAAVDRAQADQGRTIRMPVWAHDAWLELERNVNELATTLQREPNEKEIAQYVDLPVDKVRLLRRAGRFRPYSIDQPLYTSFGEESNDTLASIIPDPKADIDTYSQQLAAEIEVRRLFASSALSDREKLILGLRFATYDTLPKNLDVRRYPSGRRVQYVKRIGRAATWAGHTLEQTGRILGITRERVRQIERDALEKARDVLETP